MNVEESAPAQAEVTRAEKEAEDKGVKEAHIETAGAEAEKASNIRGEAAKAVETVTKAKAAKN